MKKIISIFVSLFIVLVVWQGTYLYSTIKKPLINNQNEAREFVMKNTPIVFVDKADFYHGTESFHVFQGMNIEGDDVLIWVPETLDDYVVERQEDGLSYHEVLNFAIDELKPEKIISIKLGMENMLPLYEIIYKDEEGRYSYYFISFKEGTYLKHYHLKV